MPAIQSSATDMSINPSDDLYEILQLDPSAEPKVIQAAYQQLALKYHPDKNKSPEAEAIMKQLNRAYEVLGDPERRAAYDQARRHRTPRSTTSDYPVPRQPVGTTATNGTSWRRLLRARVLTWSAFGAAILSVMVLVILYNPDGDGNGSPSDSLSGEIIPPSQNVIPAPGSTPTTTPAPILIPTTTPTLMLAPTPTSTLSPTPAAQLTRTPISVPGAIPTPTALPSPTLTPTSTASPTATPTPTPTNSPTLTPISDQILFQYTGKGEVNSPQFEIDFSPWVLQYQTSWDGSFGLYVQVGNSGRSVVSHAVTAGVTYETFVYDVIGTLYFTGTSIPLDGEWAIVAIESAIAPVELPFDYTGKGEVNSPQFEIDFSPWVLQYQTSWDGSFGLYVQVGNSGRSVVSHAVTAGVTYETFVYDDRNTLFHRYLGTP